MFLDKNHLARLVKIADISSPYAPINSSNISELKEQMGNELKKLQSEIKIWTYELHEKYAIALRNYCSWYLRGDERKNVLENIVHHLEESLKLKDASSAKIELSRILIEEKLVRNLDKALVYINELHEKNELPSWMNSLVEKAKRWNGDVAIPNNVDLSKLEPSPAVFREERTKLRKLLKFLIDENDNRKEIVALNLYNLGLFVTTLYGNHDCNSGVSGSEYDNAVKKAKKIAKNFKYNYLGRITNCSFLSEQDYNKIEKVFNENSSFVNVIDLVNK